MQIIKYIAVMLCVVGSRQAEPLNTNVWFYHKDNSNSRGSHLQRGYKTPRPFLLTPVTDDYSSSSWWKIKNSRNFHRTDDLPSAPQNYYKIGDFLPIKTGNIHRQHVRIDNQRYNKFHGKLHSKHSLAKISPYDPERRKSEDYLFKHLFSDKNAKDSLKKKTSFLDNINNKTTINNLHHNINNITIKYSQKLGTVSDIPLTKPNNALSRPQSVLPDKYHRPITVVSTTESYVMQPILEFPIEPFTTNFELTSYQASTEQTTASEYHKYFYDLATENSDYLTDEKYDIEGISDATENISGERLFTLQDILPLSKYSKINENDGPDSEEVTPPNTIQRIYGIIQTFSDSLTEKIFIEEKSYGSQISNDLLNNSDFKYTNLSTDQGFKQLTLTDKPDYFKVDSVITSDFNDVIKIMNASEESILPLNEVYEENLPIININLQSKNNTINTLPNLVNNNEKNKTIDRLNDFLKINKTADSDDSIYQKNINRLPIKHENTNMSLDTQNADPFGSIPVLHSPLNDSWIAVQIISMEGDIDENSQTGNQEIVAKEIEDENINSRFINNITSEIPDGKKEHRIISYSNLNPHKFNTINTAQTSNNFNHSHSQGLPKLPHVIKKETSTNLQTETTISYSPPENDSLLNKTITAYAKVSNLMEAEFQAVDPDLYLYRNMLSSNYDNESAHVADDERLRDVYISEYTQRNISKENVSNTNFTPYGLRNDNASWYDNASNGYILLWNTNTNVSQNNISVIIDRPKSNLTSKYKLPNISNESATHLSTGYLTDLYNVSDLTITTILPLNIYAKSNNIVGDELYDQNQTNKRFNDSFNDQPPILPPSLANRSNKSIDNDRYKGNMIHDDIFNVETRDIKVLSNLGKLSVPFSDQEMFNETVITNETITKNKSNREDETTKLQITSDFNPKYTGQRTTKVNLVNLNDSFNSITYLPRLLTTEVTQNDFYFDENSYSPRDDTIKEFDIFPATPKNYENESMIKYETFFNETLKPYENIINYSINKTSKETSNVTDEYDIDTMSTGRDLSLETIEKNVILQQEYLFDNGLYISGKSSNDTTISGTENEINKFEKNHNLTNISEPNQNGIIENFTVLYTNMSQLARFLDSKDGEFHGNNSLYPKIDSDLGNILSPQYGNSETLDLISKNEESTISLTLKEPNPEPKMRHLTTFMNIDNTRTIDRNQTNLFNNTDNDGNIYDTDENTDSKKDIDTLIIGHDAITNNKNKTINNIFTITPADTIEYPVITARDKEESTTKSLFDFISSMQKNTTESLIQSTDNVTEVAINANSSMLPKGDLKGISKNIEKRQEQTSKHNQDINVSGNNISNPVVMIVDPRHRRSDITIEEDSFDYYD